MRVSIVLVLAAGLAWPGRATAQERSQVATLLQRVVEYDGRVIVGFKPTTEARGMRAPGVAALTPAGVATLARQKLVDRGAQVRRQFRSVPAVAATADTALVRSLLADPAVEYVEPDWRREPTDLTVHRLSAMIAEGFTKPDATASAAAQAVPWGVDRLRAPAVWPTTKGAGVRVGIIDSGIDKDHPDLSVTGGINLVTGLATPEEWDDDTPLCGGHGTHVAGTVAALDNADFVVGVAPAVSLYALRVFDPPGGLGCFAAVSDVIAAVEWAADDGTGTRRLDVINLSLGGGQPSQAEADAFAGAYAKGVVIVAAAGNAYGPVSYPAAYPTLIAVAATDQSDTRVFFSNYGPEVEMAAPGWEVASTVPGPDVALFAGTSMAAPHVAGVAALLRAVNPALTVDAVRDYLRRGAVDLSPAGRDDYTGHGRVDALGSVNALTGTAITLAASPATVGFNVYAGAAAPTANVQLQALGGTVAWTASANRSWVTLSATSGTAAPGTPSSLSVGIDPAALGLGLHVADITIASNAVNASFTIQLRVNVAEAVLAVGGQVAGRIAQLGERDRYYFSGTAGQYVDIAQLWDLSNDDELFDPHLRLYGPDGAKLIESDLSFQAGGLYQALIAGYRLPATGTYLIEAGAWQDYDTGDYVLKLRDSGPIGAVDFTGSFLQAAQNGPPASFEMQVANIGQGTVSFTVQPIFGTWLSVTPSSGTATPSPAAAVAFGGRDRAGYRPQDRWPTPTNVPAPLKPFIPTPENVRDRLLAQTPPEIRQRLPASGVPVVLAPRTADAVAAAVVLTVTANPAGLTQDWQFGLFRIEFADTWFCSVSAPGCAGIYVVVYFRVMAPETEIVAEPLYWAYGAGRTAAGEAVIGSSTFGGAFGLPSGPPQLHVFNIDGTLARRLGRDFDPFPGGIAPDRGGNLYVGSWGFPHLTKIDPSGIATAFADNLPLIPNYIARGGDDNFYLSGCADQVYRVAGDGSLVTPFGPLLGCTTGLDYDPVSGLLWVAQPFGGVEGVGAGRIVGLNIHGGVEAEISTGDLEISGLSVGQSRSGYAGTLYITTYSGELYTVEPVTHSITALGRQPGFFFSVGDLELVDGALFLGDFFQASRLRVNDRPPDDVVRVNLSPGQVALTAPPGGAPTTRTVQLAGRATTFSITPPTAPWLSVTPLSGEVPGSFQVTANPTGLTVGTYRDVLILDLTGGSPHEVPVVLSVANTVALGGQVTGTLGLGARDRYRLDGVTGQRVDVALVGDASAGPAISDPVLRLYHPDGQVLALNDDAYLAGGGLNSLIAGVRLPVDGTYILEAAGYNDARSGGYLLKVRASGPILGVRSNSVLVRTPVGGVAPDADVQLVNLGATGTATFTPSPSAPWLSFSGSSAPSAAASDLVASLMAAPKPAVADTGRLARLRLPAGWRQGMPQYLDAIAASELSGGGKAGQLEYTARGGAGIAEPGPGLMPAGATLARVAADPATLAAGDYQGTVTLIPTDTWWPFNPTIFVYFRVFTPGSLFASGFVAPSGMDAAQNGRLLAVNVANSGGSVFEVQYPTGSLLGAKTTSLFGSIPFGGFLDGLTRVREGGWAVARLSGGFGGISSLVRVLPDGATEVLAELGCDLWGVEQGPDGNFYVADPCSQTIFQVTPGGTVRQFYVALNVFDVATGIVDPITGTLGLYVAAANAVYRFDPSNPAAPTQLVATLPQPFDDAVGIVGGASGRLYVRTELGFIYSVDPAGPTTTLLGALPNLFQSAVSSLALVTSGKLVAPGFFDWETYTFPVVDSPINDQLPIARVDPPAVQLLAPSGPNPVSTTVALGNNGAAGSFTWSATTATLAGGPWLSVSPTSGPVGVTPTPLTISANPSGLAPALYSGTVTITPTGTQNASVEIPVSFSVVPELLVSTATAQKGSLFGSLNFYVFQGTAGQPVDLAVVGDQSGTGARGFPLDDPVVAIFDASGNFLADSDDSFEAGGGLNSLIIGFTPPASGLYGIQVAGFAGFNSGDYIIKVRPAGPILGIFPPFATVLAPVGGAAATKTVEVVNLGVGALTFTASPQPSGAWLSVTPTSGTAAPGALALGVPPDALRSVYARLAGQPGAGAGAGAPNAKDWRTLLAGLRDLAGWAGVSSGTPATTEASRAKMGSAAVAGAMSDGSVVANAPRELLSLMRAANQGRDGATLSPSRAASPPGSPALVATTLTVSANPAGLPSVVLSGSVVLTPSDGWFLPEVRVFVDFRVSAPFATANTGPLSFPLGVNANATGEPVVYAAFDEGGQVVTLDAAGAVKQRRGVGMFEMLGEVYSMVRTGSDAFLLGGLQPFRGYGSSPLGALDAQGGIAILKDFFPAAGLAADGNGNLYATDFGSCLSRLDPAGTVTSLGCPFFSAWGIGYNPVDGMLYVADDPDKIWKVDPTNLDPVTGAATATLFASLSPQVGSPVSVGPLVVGSSGRLYVLDWYSVPGSGGRVLVVLPDGTVAAQLVLPSPPFDLNYGIGLAQDKLVVSQLFTGEVWTVPVLDGPVLSNQAVLAVTPNAVTLKAVKGAASVSQNVTVANNGTLGFSWNADSDQPWLAVSPPSGSLAGGASQVVTLTADPLNLPAGVHNATVAFFSAGAVGSPALVSVSFEVAASATGTVVAQWATDQVDALRGGDVTVALVADAARASAGVADYDVAASWDGAQLTFVSATSGDFGNAAFTPAATTLTATAAAATPVTGVATLFKATFTTAAGLAPGAKIELRTTFNRLTGAGGGDLRGELAAPVGQLCVALFPWGDMDRNGTIGSNDALQGLRAAAGLSLGPGVSRELGDVNRDGVTSAVDVVQVLRHLVGLSVTAPVDRYAVGPCPPAGGTAPPAGAVTAQPTDPPPDGKRNAADRRAVEERPRGRP